MMTLSLFILLLALQVADVASTAYVIDRGIGRETNPLMIWLIDSLGLAFGLLLPKVVMLSLIYLFAIKGEYAACLLGGLVALYVIVIFNNAKVIWRNK